MHVSWRHYNHTARGTCCRENLTCPTFLRATRWVQKGNAVLVTACIHYLGLRSDMRVLNCPSSIRICTRNSLEGVYNFYIQHIGVSILRLPFSGTSICYVYLTDGWQIPFWLWIITSASDLQTPISNTPYIEVQRGYIGLWTDDIMEIAQK